MDILNFFLLPSWNFLSNDTPHLYDPCLLTQSQVTNILLLISMNSVLFTFIYFYVFMYVLRGTHIHVKVHMWKPEDKLQLFVLSFHHVVLGLKFTSPGLVANTLTHWVIVNLRSTFWNVTCNWDHMVFTLWLAQLNHVDYSY